MWALVWFDIVVSFGVKKMFIKVGVIVGNKL